MASNPQKKAITQGRELKALRVRAGLTQEEAAELVDIAPITLSRWERGSQPAADVKARELLDHYSRLRAQAEGQAPLVVRELPRVALGLPQPIRLWIQEFLLELVKADVSEREVEEARRVLTAPELARLLSGGEPGEETEAQILRGLEGFAAAIRDTLRSRGYEIPK